MQRERDTAYGLTLVWALVAVHGCLFRRISPLPTMVAWPGGAAMQRERDTAYGLTLVWALVAVYGQQPSRAVRIAALVCVSLNMLLAIVSLLRWAAAMRPCGSPLVWPWCGAHR